MGAVIPALRAWFASLEGWRRAALVSGLVTSIWVFLIQAPAILLTERPLSVSAIFMTLGIAGLIFLAPLWAWGIAVMYRPWLEQPEQPEVGVFYVGVILVQLVLGGLEAAFPKIVPSITFLGALPVSAAHGVQALSLPSNDPTEIED
jgi:hypothetical protein